VTREPPLAIHRLLRPLRLSATRCAHRVWGKKGWISTLLLPLAWITAAVVRRRQRQAHPPPQSRLPVVVVGNILVGGTGKTPVVMAVIEALQARGWTPGLISRGYGARAGATPRHGAGKLDPTLFGDEPSLIAAQTGAPVAVHRSRVRALRALEQAYPAVDVVIADDGLQHLALHRDVEIAVQDSRGCGNGRLLPAGPLREPAGRLDRVDFLLTQQDAASKDASSENAVNDAAAPGRNTVRAPRVVQSAMRLHPAILQHLASDQRLRFDAWLAQYADVAVSAVAGIGVPQRFFQMLRRAGVRLDHAISLADHDDYRHPPFARLPDAPILITPKDAVKCAHLRDSRLWVVHPRVEFSDPSWLDVLDGRLRHIRWQRSEATMER